MENIKELVNKKLVEMEYSIEEFRREKNKELFQYCLSIGVKYFWSYKRNFNICEDPKLDHYVEIKECSCCGFTEERNVEQEVVVDLSEYKKEMQKKGITESLRKMGLIKKEEK